VAVWPRGAILTNRFKFVALLLGLLCNGLTNAHAGDYTPYVGIGTGIFSTEYFETQSLGSLSMRGTSWGGFIKAGIDYRHYGGLEIRLGSVGSKSGHFAAGTIGSASAFDLNIRMNTFISYLGKAKYPVTPYASIYALLGGTAGHFSNVSTLGVRGSTKTWKTQLSYGMGADYNTKGLGLLEIEWIQYWKDVPLSIATNASSKASMSGLNFSVSKFF